MSALVGVIMGSKSDWSTLSHTADMLDKLGMPDTTNPKADEGKRPIPPRQPPRARHPREQAKALFPSQDFH